MADGISWMLDGIQIHMDMGWRMGGWRLQVPYRMMRMRDAGNGQSPGSRQSAVAEAVWAVGWTCCDLGPESMHYPGINLEIPRYALTTNNLAAVYSTSYSS